MLSEKIVIDIVEFLALYGYIWLIFLIIYTKEKQLDYIKNYKKVSLYFISAALLPIIYFRQNLFPFVQHVSIFPFLLLCLFYLLTLIFYKTITSHSSSLYIKKQYIGVQQMTAMDWRFLIAKSCDVLFQETIFVIWYSLLFDMKISIVYMIYISMLITFFTHFCMFFFIKRSAFYVWYLTIASTIASIFFPYLILRVHYGFIYTFMIHLLIGFILQGIIYNTIFPNLSKNSKKV